MNAIVQFPGFRRRFGALAALAVLASVVGASRLQAELVVTEDIDDRLSLTVYKLTVSPAAAPSPVFKFRLLPSEADLLPGNAALYYTRAFAEGGVGAIWKGIEKEYGHDEVHGGEKRDAWYSPTRPLTDLPLDKVRAAAAGFDTTIDQFVARGSQRATCDWGRNLEELVGPDVIALLLPEIQESRSLSRAIMLKTRVAIADRDFNRAIELLQMNYQMGRNVAADPILISGLVGIAECAMGNQTLLELIATPGSPNMYWALAAMPRPVIDTLPAVRWELSWFRRIFPVLGEAETAEHSPEEWGRLLAGALREGVVAIGPGQQMDVWTSHAAVTGLALVTYAEAKQRLIADGMDPERVEAMPVGQVVAIDAAREARRIGDEFEKRWYMPYPEMKRAGDPDAVFDGNKLAGGLGRMLSGMLMPALQAVRSAQTRLDWQTDGLQVIEALRIHAADTGKFPAALDEIKAVNVPLNPATGKPFQYRLEGDTAILELPGSDGFPGVAYRFEIKLAK